MPGPAQHGVLIYSGNLPQLADFYVQLFDMHITRETKDLISLDKDGFTLIIHVPPFDIPAGSVSPVKLFLSVQNMAATREKAIALGGSAFDGEWANPIFTVSNIADSDGNHIQIRQFTHATTGD